MAAYKVSSLERLFFDPHLFKSQSALETFRGNDEKDLRNDGRDSIRNLRKLVKEKTDVGLCLSDRFASDDCMMLKRSIVGYDAGMRGKYVSDTDLSQYDGGQYSERKPRNATNGYSRSNKLYGSTPSFGKLKSKHRQSNRKDSFKYTSLPSNINLVNIPASTENDDETKKRKNRLPSIGKIVSEDSVLGETNVNENPKHFGDTIGEETENESQPPKDEQFQLLEKQVDQQVTNNWMLHEDIKNAQRIFERRKQALSIHVPNDDPIRAIETRLDEIKHMAKPRRDERHVLERISPEFKARIVKIQNMDFDTWRKEQRKGWKSADRIRWAARMVTLLSAGFNASKRYYVDKTDAGALRKKFEKEVNANTHNGLSRSSISHEMQICLTTQPRYRDKKTIKQILWLLRATKAFKHLFPAEMETEVAKYVAYEKYDDGRIISYQSREPDRFYYVLAGRVSILRQFKLFTGHVTKTMGFLTNGMTTDPEELEQQWLREDSLVAKGQVEVLLLDKQTFKYLLHTTVGPPVEFMKSIDLFEDFPVEKFPHNPDAIEYTYYGPGKIIVKDSNRTPWLHVVKSGLVKVVRHQDVIDAETKNESKFGAHSVEELGTGKFFSHADSMLGILAKQRKFKRMNTNLSLPKIDDNSMAYSQTNPFSKTIDVEPREQLSPMICRNSRRSSQNGSVKEVMFDIDESHGNKHKQSASTYKDNSSTDENVYADSSSMMSADANQTADENQGRAYGTALPPLLNIPTISADTYNPHDLWLTREKTDYDTIFAPKRQKETIRRQAYLQLDILKPGDVFGLDHLQPALASEPHGVSLLSDGAEVVKINKRFFLQQAGNNTMLKVETMYREYISEQEAEEALFEQESWEQYKDALWQRMIAPRVMSPSFINKHKHSLKV